MKLNENTALIGSSVVLVPYKTHHVKKYHSWMSLNDDLRECTASELLTFEQELQLQKDWISDENKLTFIILSSEFIRTCKEEDSMIGDINLFKTTEFDHLENSWEINMMIAEKEHRNKGNAQEAINLMISYAIEYLHAKHFIAKISAKNTASINLFKHKLNFIEMKYCKVFDEITLCKTISKEQNRLIQIHKSDYSSFPLNKKIN